MSECVVVGYVRLSRDDDKKNYSSIENQKNIIERYAKENGMVIREFYEDDGVSGYLFDRPSFSLLLKRLEVGEIDVIIAKDLSRIGRNNPKVLMFLEYVYQIGKRLILIDDNYDTQQDNDDCIGIKSWFNERYVKDASKKIKTVLRMKQQEGSYVIHAPYGYVLEKRKFILDEEHADVVRKIFELYLEGYGYRRIAEILNTEHIHTPSMVRREAIHRKVDCEKGLIHIADQWRDYTVRDLLKNDFYMGTYRTHKREKRVIHGTDCRVPKAEQYVFENHHKPIISKKDYEDVQNIMKSRAKNRFARNHMEEANSPFVRTMFCKDCGAKLVFIRRETKNTVQKYFICSTYNTKGKAYCKKAHLVQAKDMELYYKSFLAACTPIWSKAVDSIDVEYKKSIKEQSTRQLERLKQRERQYLSELKGLIQLKLNDIEKGEEFSVINETYQQMQKEITEKLRLCQANQSALLKQLKELPDGSKDGKERKLAMVKRIVDDLTMQKVESLVSRIGVDEFGIIEIKLKYRLEGYVVFDLEECLNQEENKKIKAVFELISKEEGGYISTRLLVKNMKELGYVMSMKAMEPYMQLAVLSGVLKQTEENERLFEIVAEQTTIMDGAFL